MPPTVLFVVLLVLSSVAYYWGRRRALALAGNLGGARCLHSRPTSCGTLTALACGIPALLLLGLWLAFEPVMIKNLVIADLPEEIRSLPANRLNLVVNDIQNRVSGNIAASAVDPALQAAADQYRDLKETSHAALAVVALCLGIAGTIAIRRKITETLRARNHVERAIHYMLVACSCIAIFTTIGIVLSVLYESIRFFKAVPITEFLFGLDWSPQMAIRADQVGSSAAFGAVPVFLGTALI